MMIMECLVLLNRKSVEYSGGYRNGYTHWHDENGKALLIEHYVNERR